MLRSQGEFQQEAVKFQANVKNRWHLGLKKLIKKERKSLEQMCAFALKMLKVEVGWKEAEFS